MSFNRLPKGSIVLVTGFTGFIGVSIHSAITGLLLQKGYRVRGVTRNTAKAELHKKHFESLFGPGSLEIVEVPNYAAPGVFVAAVKGMSSFSYAAFPESLTGRYHEDMIAAVVAGTTAILKAAATEASVKSVVTTASRITAFVTEYGKEAVASHDTFTDFFIPLAKNTTDDNPLKPIFKYAASKVAGEMAAWDYWKETEPSYAFNVVIPDHTAGPLLTTVPGDYSSHDWLNDLFLGNPNSYSVPFMNPRVSLEIYHADEVLKIWRDAYPDRKILPDFGFPPAPHITIDSSKSTKLIWDLEGRDWYTLQDIVLGNVKRVARD
ncbi:hypothetical protein BKA62DRAFT_670471 [Auriculariales sp. MPI-PUGE-AT-0066]|nr:hypothetical protein BKA62DRAFT_670471 [Auriculariales sp. MPI-PUGE-AT-0066]